VVLLICFFRAIPKPNSVTNLILLVSAVAETYRAQKFRYASLSDFLLAAVNNRVHIDHDSGDVIVEKLSCHLSIDFSARSDP